MAEMFGTPIGTQAFVRDAQAGVTFGLDAQESLGRIAMQPVQQKYKELQTEKLQTEITEARDVRELMRAAIGQEQAGQVDLPTKLNNAANLLMNSGRVVQGADLANKASLIMNRETMEASRQALAKAQQVKQMREQAEFLGQMYQGVGSQEDLDAANRLFSFQTGQKAPLEGAAYSPEVLQRLRQNALSVKEQADLEEKKLVRQGAAENRSRLTNQFELEQNIRQERLDLNKQKEDRLRKQGGGRLPAAEPKREELAQVENLLMKDYPFLKGAKEEERAAMKDAVYTIAAEARALMRRNPALSTASAINQAYTTAQRSGDLGIETSRVGALLRDMPGAGNLGKTFKFSGGGRSPETALAFPKSPADVKTGRYYVSPAGRLLQWDGKLFQPVAALTNTRPLSGDNTYSEREEEDY